MFISALFIGVAAASNQSRVFNYASLQQEIDGVKEQLHAHGFILVDNVSGYVETRKAFLEAAQRFANLSASEQATCTARNP